MAGREWDERERGEWEEDPDGPQDCDLCDDEEPGSAVCPACGAEVSELAQRCPACGDWIVPEAAGRRRRGGRVLMAVVGLLALAAIARLALGAF